MTVKPNAVLQTPTRPNFIARAIKISGFRSHDIILGSQRELGHQPLQRPKNREEMGKEYSVYEPSRDKPRGPHELPHSRAADKPRIFVVGAGVDRTDGERVPWIVLKDEAQAVALQNASQLRNKDRVLHLIDVVKNARSKHQIERVIIERQSVAVQLDILGSAGKPRSSDIQALPGHIRANHLCVRKQCSKTWYRCTDAG